MEPLPTKVRGVAGIKAARVAKAQEKNASVRLIQRSNDPADRNLWDFNREAACLLPAEGKGCPMLPASCMLPPMSPVHLQRCTGAAQRILALLLAHTQPVPSNVHMGQQLK